MKISEGTYISNDKEIIESIGKVSIYCFDIQNPKGIVIVHIRRNEASIGARYPFGIEIALEELIVTLNVLSPIPRKKPNMYCIFNPSTMEKKYKLNVISSWPIHTNICLYINFSAYGKINNGEITIPIPIKTSMIDTSNIVYPELITLLGNSKNRNGTKNKLDSADTIEIMRSSLTINVRITPDFRIDRNDFFVLSTNVSLVTTR